MTNDRPSSLVKFTDASQGIDILQRQCVPWLAPHLIHGPFENSAYTELGFNKVDLSEALMKTIASLVFSPEGPHLEGKNPLKRAIRRWRSEDRFHTEEEVMAVLKELLSSMIDPYFDNVTTYFNAWKAFANDIYILSLYEDHTNLACWDQMTDDHRGLGIRFKCGNSAHEQLADYLVLDPEPVQYCNMRKTIVALKRQVEIILDNAPEPSQSEFKENLLVKGKYLNKQKEWRCFYKYSNDRNIEAQIVSEGVIYKHFLPKEIMAIYLGADMKQEDKKNVMDLIKKSYGQVKVFQAKAHGLEFKLDFQALN